MKDALKSICFWAVAIVVTFIYSLLVMFGSLIGRSGNHMAAICRQWGRSLVKIAKVKINVIGAENAKVSGAKIYMSNHQSYFDVFALAGYLPDNIRFVAKKTLEYIPIFGQAMRAAGTVIVDRRKPEIARKIMTEIGEARMGRGVGVIVFPEGTRSRDGKIGEFKKGGFMLALQSGATIIPVGVSGSEKILPAKSLRVKSGEIKIRIGAPISAKDFTIENKNALIERTRIAIAELAGKPLRENAEKAKNTDEAVADDRRNLQPVGRRLQVED